MAMLLAAVLLAGAHFAKAGTSAAGVNVSIDWGRELTQTRTAATVEVDVMPFLGRADFGGPFDGYYQALSNLGAEYVRYSPWFMNPRAVVPELTPSDCTVEKPATNWNSTYFDAIMRDFMHAVCGPNAESGECTHSVVQQLSTMPSWLFKDAFCPNASEACLPENPWNTPVPYGVYSQTAFHNGTGWAHNGTNWTQGTGTNSKFILGLVDPTCDEMAKAMGRQVGWYTAGGFTDECGHYHKSGLHYSWYGLSIGNEGDWGPGVENGPAYVQCYDKMEVEIRKQGNLDVILVGPEVTGDGNDWKTGRKQAPFNESFLQYHLNGSNHADGKVPEISSYHMGVLIHSGDGEKAMRAVVGNGSFEPFVYKNDHFTKTVSGQTQGKLTKECRFRRRAWSRTRTESCKGSSR